MTSDSPLHELEQTPRGRNALGAGAIAVVVLVLAGLVVSASSGASSADTEDNAQDTQCWDEYRRVGVEFSDARLARRFSQPRSVVMQPGTASQDCTAATECLYGYRVRGNMRAQRRVLVPHGANPLTTCDQGKTRTLVDPSADTPVGECWDEYRVRAGSDPFHLSVIATAGSSPSTCVPAEDCLVGFKTRKNRQNRIFVPRGADPAAGCDVGETADDDEEQTDGIPVADPATPVDPTETTVAPATPAEPVVPTSVAPATSEAPTDTAPPTAPTTTEVVTETTTTTTTEPPETTTQAPETTTTTEPPETTTTTTTTTEAPSAPDPASGSVVYFNDFSSPNDGNRIDNFVHYRDPWVVNHTSGSSDHAANGSIDCSAPEQTRAQTRENPHGHIYQCFPMGNAAAGHMMGYAMDTAGYGFVGGLPDQVFEGVSEVSVDVNTTSAGLRNFVEIKVIPAGQTFVNAMPCGPDFPCNDGWDYDDVNGVGAATVSQEGTGLVINTPARPDGYDFDEYNRSTASNGDVVYQPCGSSGFCFKVALHEGNTGIRARSKHVFKDNGDGTLSFGIDEGGTMHWVTAPGSFPDGPVRVVVAFHNYTATKDGNGPGYAGNVSPSSGGFTWHWDNLAVVADKATPSVDYWGGHSADRIVTPDGCIAFSQGQRLVPNNTDIAPQIICDSNGWQ